jgi:Zn/Cd-binding protein ZinT
MTKTDKDDTEIDSRLLASFCFEDSVVRYTYLANYGEGWQTVLPFG